MRYLMQRQGREGEFNSAEIFRFGQHFAGSPFSRSRKGRPPKTLTKHKNLCAVQLLAWLAWSESNYEANCVNRRAYFWGLHFRDLEKGDPEKSWPNLNISALLNSPLDWRQVKAITRRIVWIVEKVFGGLRFRGLRSPFSRHPCLSHEREGIAVRVYAMETPRELSKCIRTVSKIEQLLCCSANLSFRSCICYCQLKKPYETWNQ